MTLDEARALLDAIRDCGRSATQAEIVEALIATGDLAGADDGTVGRHQRNGRWLRARRTGIQGVAGSRVTPNG